MAGGGWFVFYCGYTLCFVIVCFSAARSQDSPSGNRLKEVPKLIDRSLQIIQQQDAEEGRFNEAMSNGADKKDSSVTVVEVQHWTYPSKDEEARPSYSIMDANMADDIILSGSSVLTNAKETDGELVHLEEVVCPPPAQVEHGHLEDKDYKVGAVVLVVCEPGYTLFGSERVTCLALHDPPRYEWQPKDMPECVVNPPSTLQGNNSNGMINRQSSKRLTKSRPNSSQVEGLNWICSLPKVVGPCRALLPRFFFDVNILECTTFDYGGCHGNENNFETMEACQNACH